MSHSFTWVDSLTGTPPSGAEDIPSGNRSGSHRGASNAGCLLRASDLSVWDRMLCNNSVIVTSLRREHHEISTGRDRCETWTMAAMATSDRAGLHPWRVDSPIALGNLRRLVHAIHHAWTTRRNNDWLGVVAVPLGMTATLTPTPEDQRLRVPSARDGQGWSPRVPT